MSSAMSVHAGVRVLESSDESIRRALETFRNAAAHVPAYQQILAEAGVAAGDVVDLSTFLDRVPQIDKGGTFMRFDVRELCVDGQVGKPLSVLTSSGHTGRFSYGVYDLDLGTEETVRTDDALDVAIGIRSRSTLMINCLPMGVGVPTQVCAVAQTSVRPDMVTAIMQQFASGFDQVLLIGEMAFVKHVLERGQQRGVDWKGQTVHVIVGEEPLAENARAYVSEILGTNGCDADKGVVISSMGMGEIGLNLFFEAPAWTDHPNDALVRLRGLLHRDANLRRAVLGEGAGEVPMCMTYDPDRLFVEVLDDGSLVLTALSPHRTVPLVRYNTGDKVRVLDLSDAARAALADAGFDSADIEGLPVVLFEGRGEGVLVDGRLVTPEQIKEGLYADPDLTRRTTCNFRLTEGQGAAHVRIQLTPDAEGGAEWNERFERAIAPYAAGSVSVSCEPYAAFGDGMELDYERKFRYVGRKPVGERAAEQGSRTD